MYPSYIIYTHAFDAAAAASDFADVANAKTVSPKTQIPQHSNVRTSSRGREECLVCATSGSVFRPMHRFVHAACRFVTRAAHAAKLKWVQARNNAMLNAPSAYQYSNILY